MKIISVDLQREFTTPKGACYVPGKAVEFILETLIPHLRDRGIKLAEIISDYRQPRPGDRRDCLYPGTEMYLSEIPEDVKDRPVWVKCMNSPVWVRENIGVAGAPPGPPYPNPEAFDHWLEMVVGERDVLLIGLSLDRCVLATAQELTYRGYKVFILPEGTDPSSGDPREKEYLLTHPPIIHWATPLKWERARRLL